MAESKYAKYVLRDPRGKGPPPRKPPTAPGISLGVEGLAGVVPIECNFNFVGILAPHVLADPPHKHDVDELLFFISTDPKAGVDLGGEVEVALGEGWEKQVIDTPAIICIPKGVQHAPIYVKKVDRPFYFGHCLLAATYGSNATPAV
ncbi:MAG: hypothetical protein A2147_04850 [Chloroflexi bacterium RBG_16_57_8]|nr:MAG: hypothetical protein A2147_04850 [Chloroflexi bacterium RBG_16_57_8]